MFVKDDDYWEAKKESKNQMTKVIKVWSGKEEAIHDAGFANGADFGFQKGIKARINTTTISDCPIKDEWHKVTDWEDNSQFPKDESVTYLVRLYLDHYVVCELDITEGYRQFYLVDNLDDIDPQDVIAWKEIVPPKE